MSTLSFAARDSATMLTRDLRHALRYPSMTIGIVALPVIFLLLFAYVFGGAIGAGISGAARGAARYIDYLAPGIIIMTAASTCVATAVSVCIDMTQGIVARFRTMAIFRPSLLTGHVVGSVIKTMLAIGFVTGVALLIGFRPTADPIRWLAAIGLLAMFTFALTWLSVALGLVSKSPETASNLPIPLTLLPFLGSGFVPTNTMPVGLRWFAEYQPFTAVIETLRGLLMGTPIGNNAVLAIAWSVGITLVGYFWAKALYNRDPVR